MRDRRISMHWFLAISIGVAMLAPSAARAADPETLIQEVKIQFGDTQGRATMRHLTDEDRAFIKAASARCIAAVDKAVKGGIAETTEIDVGSTGGKDVPNARYDEKTFSFHVTLTAARDYCRSAGDRIQLAQIAALFKEQSAWFTVLDRADVDAAKLNQADDAVKACREAVKKTLAGGASKSAKINWEGFDGKQGDVTLGDADAKFCTAIADKAAKRRADLQAAAEAKLKPWLEALKDDKLRLFKEKNLHAAWTRGKGGGFLETPQMMADAKLWFIVYTFDGGDGWTHWRVVRYQFDGHKLKKTSEKTGRGNDPPKNVYK